MAEQEEKIFQERFKSLIKSFVTNAKINLGQKKNPLTGETNKNIDQAKQQIEMLKMLQVKTEGNLKEGEKKLLDEKVSTLKKLYVQEKMDE